MITKLGPHIIRRTSAAMQWAATAPVVKSLDDVSILAAAHPNALRIFRHVWPYDRPPVAPTDEAAGLIGALAGYRHPRLYVEVGGNEQATAAGDGARLAIVATELRKAGIRSAGPNWATGAYTESDFDELRQAGLDAWALHAYWADAGPTQWNGLRWQQWWKPGDPPVIITECGRDVVRDGPANVNGGLIGRGGWHRDGISDQQYINELVDYDARLQADTSVLGALVFTAGPTADWQPYEIDSIIPQLVSMTQPPTAVPLPQPPQPQPGGTVTTPKFSVGPGVAAKLKEVGATPTSDERWVGQIYSLTFTDKGICYYNPQSGQVLFQPAR